MNLGLIKQFLKVAGINNLAVRFDDHNRQIVATFTRNSQDHTELIKYKDIEDLFTEEPPRQRSKDLPVGSFQPPAGPAAEENPPKAS